ncbi:MAG: HD domain-containing phosphohydrolase [Candidatus Thiodiazotropha sp.]|nr:response regulator [Candidatus Thiodiazotropha taylori]MBT3060787.1 response regulator [Candidatus Thiodiazotropha sp. (ex Lucina pensylvanica)]MBT3063886.1 response regulator [Candidatus Thiodiazotropha sp. (ex Lucina pensylvanica)]PUB72706.1 MAG: two-component system response regulator [gamma proteobacterium symbiont of Ctena orbiculata]PUB78041.1 MAG: two-component system response regulator [gamma proteobacterium symbiont of Ctena orbiculata]
MSQVLIIDDQSITRMILQELVGSIDKDIASTCFADPTQALEWAKTHDIDLVITDYKMPQMDGIEFIKWLRRIPRCNDVPVMIVTCVEDQSVRYLALESGANDFITKPIDHTECRARCHNMLTMSLQRKLIKDRALLLEREIRKTTQELRDREQETLMRLAKAGEYRDEDTGNHILRISRYSKLIAHRLGLSHERCDLIAQSAPMHDIGKIGIPDAILLKPGRLTSEEYEIMQRHTVLGYEILKDSLSKYIQTGAVIALNHHEKFNGEGYPHGLSGEAIPIEARIVAIADVFDALVTDRPYKKSWSIEKAIEYISEERGRHFDPDCAEAFLSELQEVELIHHALKATPSRTDA